MRPFSASCVSSLRSNIMKKTEGTIVDSVADDEDDDLTEEERLALHDARSASWKSAEAGGLRPSSAILNEFRQRRR